MENEEIVVVVRKSTKSKLTRRASSPEDAIIEFIYSGKENGKVTFLYLFSFSI